MISKSLPWQPAGALGSFSLRDTQGCSQDTVGFSKSLP